MDCPNCGAPLDAPEHVCGTPSLGTGGGRAPDLSEPRNLARIAQLVALVGFVLPWITVSCQGRALAQVSGLDMALGRATIHNPFTGVSHVHHGAPNGTIVFALVFILAGLAVSFNLAVVRVALANAISCATSLALIGYEVLVSAGGALRSEAASSETAGNGFTRGIAESVKVSTGFGFWLTCLALAAATFFYWRARTGGAEAATAGSGKAAPTRAPQMRTNLADGEPPPEP